MKMVAQKYWTENVTKKEEFAGKFYSELVEVEVEGQIWLAADNTLTAIVIVEGDEYRKEEIKVAIDDDCIWTPEEQMEEAIEDAKNVWEKRIA